MTIKVGKVEGEGALLSATPNNPQAGMRPVGWNLMDPENGAVLLDDGQLRTTAARAGRRRSRGGHHAHSPLWRSPRSYTALARPTIKVSSLPMVSSDLLA